MAWGNLCAGELQVNLGKGDEVFAARAVRHSGGGCTTRCDMIMIPREHVHILVKGRRRRPRPKGRPRKMRLHVLISRNASFLPIHMPSD